MKPSKEERRYRKNFKAVKGIGKLIDKIFNKQTP